MSESNQPLCSKPQRIESLRRREIREINEICVHFRFSGLSCHCRLNEEEGGVPSSIAEAHRQALQEVDDIVRREQQVT